MNLSKLTLALVGLSAFVSAQAAVVINVNQNTASLFTGTFSIDDAGFANQSVSSTLVNTFTILTDGTEAGLGTTDASDLVTFNVANGSVLGGFASGSFLVGATTVNYSFSNVSSTGSILTGDFSFAAVPEPSEYAAIAGAGLIGFAAWRRSRKNLA